MKRRISGSILIFLIIFSGFSPILAVTDARARGDFEIVDDAVVIDDDRVFLSAEPHTIASSGWVEFTLISKQYSGNIDVVWGFNQTESRPKTPQIWANYSHTLWRWIEVEKTDINETTLEEFNYTGHEKEYYESTFFDWKDINLDFNKRLLNAKGMDTWYVLKEVNVEANKEYRLRCFVEIPFAGNYIVRGKYAWGIKVSSDTLRDAITKDRFYFMDPWFDSSWLYRTKITVDSGDVDEVLTNFTVMVYFNSSRIKWSHIQDDLDDIRFTSDDEVTLLDYEIEDIITNVEAWLWVRLPIVSNTSDTEFYMYFGNIGASSGEDKEGSWDDNYVMVQHMVDETTSTILDSTQYDNDGVKRRADEPIETVNGQIDSAQVFDGVNDRVDVGNIGNLSSFSLSAWIKASTDVSVFRTILDKSIGASDRNFWLYLEINTGKLGLKFSVGGAGKTFVGDTSLNDNVWHYVAVTYDNSSVSLYVEGGLDRVPFAQIGTPDFPVRTVYLGYQSTRVFNDTLDEIRISNTTRSTAWIETSYESERDDLLDWGVEETILVAPSAPDLLFGAGFNASAPYVELRWNHSLVNVTFFEIQNFSDAVSWTYLGQSTTANYTDTQVINGTERYYRVRANNLTEDVWYNSSFSEINFETVYFIPARAITLNVTGLWTYFNASAIQIVVGIHEAGTLSDILVVDGLTYNCSEIAGTPGYWVSINFTDVSLEARCLWLTSYLYYDGANNHEIEIQLYNFTGSAWVKLGNIVDMLDFDWYNVSTYDLRLPATNFINATGSVLARFYHVINGNINDDIFIDYVRLIAEIPTVPEPEAEAFEFFWIVLAIALMLIGIVISKMWFEGEN